MGKGHFSVDQYLIESEIRTLDILHSDIQGAEGNMLMGSINVLNKIGFFVLSTHGNLHIPCMNFLISNNFTILVEHSVEQSVSADGLIIAVNNLHIKKYEKNINTNIQEYFNTNCPITKH